jgi:NTP pyrophosphatase (non-canonical NTP hydrolase)
MELATISRSISNQERLKMSFAEVELEVIRWAEARQIIPNSNPKAQSMKTLEEAGELLEAATALKVLKDAGMEETPIYAHWQDKYKDAIGDVMVTLVIGAALADVDVVECFKGAYEEIKERTGTMNSNGIFVKD